VVQHPSRNVRCIEHSYHCVAYHRIDAVSPSSQSGYVQKSGCYLATRYDAPQCFAPTSQAVCIAACYFPSRPLLPYSAIVLGRTGHFDLLAHLKRMT